MPMTKEQRAAYMRSYRAKKGDKVNVHLACDTRIALLEALAATQDAEIARLKTLLAERGISSAVVHEWTPELPPGDDLDDVLGT